MKANINFFMFVNKKGAVNINLANKHKEWIIENTSEYNWLAPTLGQRVRLKIEAPKKFYCDCGERLSWNKSKGFIFKKTCNNQKCVIKNRSSSLSSIKFKETISNRKYKKEYNIEQQKEYVVSRLKSNIKPNYILSNKSEDIVLYMSEKSKILGLFKTEYCYRLVKDISLDEPVTCHCGLGNSSFISFEKGYRSYCDNCRLVGASSSRSKNRLEKLKKDLELIGYTLLSNNNINESQVKVKHNLCGYEFDKWMNNGFIPSDRICPKCFPRNISSYEYLLINEIKNVYTGEIIQQFKLTNTKNVNSFKSIDIYLPEFKLGIEINGLYWHSNNDSKCHIYKLEKSNELGIQLMQFTDKDIDEKFPIIMSMIKHKMRLSKKIGARKTKVEEINTKLYREFLEKNHIQGYASATIKLGLFFEDKLVSIFSVSKSRFKKDEYEIIRYCSLINHTIVGGFSKFKKYFSIKYPEITKLITFADRSYGTGDGYIKAGLKFIKYTTPNYYYLSSKYILHSRQHFQKHKLKSKLDFYDDSLSEKKLMEIAGYKRYYDCGNVKYVLNL